MAFLDRVTDIGRSAAKKSEELMDVARVKIRVSDNRSAMKELEIQIGRLIYEKYQAGNRENLEPELLELCEKIKERDEENSELESSMQTNHL